MNWLRYLLWGLTTLSVCAVLVGTVNADWPQFRGPNSSGIATGPAPPDNFGPGRNELWKVPLAVGHSSPCIIGDAIFLTTYDEEQSALGVVCVNRSTGKIQWQSDVPADEIEKGHPSFNPASSTPTSDGERVVAYFGSFGLVCFDLRGEKLWSVRMPLAKSFGGNAISPVIVGDRVILYRGSYEDHFLLAVDKHSGQQLWKVPQEEPFTGEMACTACPIVHDDKLIVHSARSIQALEVSTGKLLWVLKCATTATSTPLVVGEEVIVAAWNKMGEPALRPSFPDFETLIKQHDNDGDSLIARKEFPTLWIFHRPEGAEAPMNGGTVQFQWADRNKDQKITPEEWSQQLKDLAVFRARYESHGLLAIPLESEGSVEKDQIRTLETQGIPEVPSPVSDGTYLYLVKNGGVVTCIELKTGRRVYRIRTPGRGTHYASPVIADGKLYTASGDGSISVLKLGADPQIIATNKMPDAVYATPAIVNGTIYVRTHSALHAFGHGPDESP